MNKTGILLTNIGTPIAPTKHAVKQYLSEFLSDKNVIELPRLFWYPILYCFILPIRAKQSAKLYKSIWTDKGSPLLVFTKKLAAKLQSFTELAVEIGMNYGKPNIQQALSALQKKQVNNLIILPLYPQNSATTNVATLNQITNILGKWRNIPSFSMINGYSSQEIYIDTIAKQITNKWAETGKKYLVFSFHGIPENYIKKGDPYKKNCEQTIAKLVKKLKLTSKEYSFCYQSRLGPTKWLQPYTDDIMVSLPKKGITDIQVICPGFAVDCLETLEEVKIGYREKFYQSGGKNFEYIPALNYSDEHINMLTKLITQHLSSINPSSVQG